MKVGLHLSMLCQKWTDDVSGYLQELKDAGLDGVEISLFGTTEELLTKAFAEAQRLHFDVFCGTGVGPDTDPSSSDPEIRKNALKYLKGCVDTAYRGGAHIINGVLYAPWQGFSDEAKEVRWNHSASVLREVAEYAKDKDIQLNVEVINRFETDFMNTLDEGSKFVELIDRENVKLLVDTFHMNIEEDNICQAIRNNIQNIGHVHVCENHRGVPGTGHIPWKEIVQTFKEVGYDGYLEMETFTEAGTEVAKGMSIWRNISNNAPLEEAKKGCKYLKNIIEEVK